MFRKISPFLMMKDFIALSGDGRQPASADSARVATLARNGDTAAQPFDNFQHGITLRGLHAFQASLPAELLASDALAFSEICAKIAIIVQLEWLRIVQPQPFSCRRSAAGPRMDRNGAPIAQLGGIQFGIVTRENHAARQSQEASQQTAMFERGHHFMRVDAALRAARFQQIGRIAIEDRIVRNRVSGRLSIEPRYRIATNDGDDVGIVIFGDYRRQSRTDCSIAINGDAGQGRALISEHCGRTGKRLDIHRVWRDLVDNGLIDAGSVFSAWIVHLVTSLVLMMRSATVRNGNIDDMAIIAQNDDGVKRQTCAPAN